MAIAEPLKIEEWPLVELLPYANNSREHSAAQIDQIAASIKEFGFINPCLVDANGVLIAGHGRVAGAQKLGMRSVPVIRLGHLSDTQTRALRIADNSIALNSTWNEETLRVELADLKLADYPLEMLAFSDAQLISFTSDLRPPSAGSHQLNGYSYSVIVNCKDEADQKEKLEYFAEIGLECRALIS